MEPVMIKLSKAHREFIDAQMAAGRFRSVQSYFDALLKAERKRKAEELLVRLVREAEESGPATPMTRDDWDNLKRRVWERHAQAQAEGAKSAASRQKDRRRNGSR